MADEGYWKATARRAPRPPLAVGMIALAAALALGAGVALAELVPPVFPGLTSGLIAGQPVTSIIAAAIALGLIAAIGGWAVLEGVARARGRSRPEPWAFLFLAPAGVAGALSCALLLPGPLDDRLTQARIDDSWAHYVATVRFDETRLRGQLGQLELWAVFEPYNMARPNHWAAVRTQLKLGRELIAKYRGYELYRRDEALKTVEEGNLRPAARAKARQRILSLYAQLAPMFAQRWDAIEAQIDQTEKAADLLQASRGGWRITPTGVAFTDLGQLRAINAIMAKGRDLEAQEHSAECKLDAAFGLNRYDCGEVDELVVTAKKRR